jgi:hypothetical protein
MIARVLISVLGVCLLAMPGAAQEPRPLAQASARVADRAELWVDPLDLSSRDFFNGPWGAEHAPDRAAIYTFVKPKEGGINPGMTVRDPAGRQWKVKQPPLTGRGAEGPIEVVLSRVLAGIGYHQPPVYYLPTFLLTRGAGGAERVVGGRFRLSLKNLKERDDWSWTKNPFAGTRELNGLLVILLMFNSSDLKNSNNSLYEYTPPGAERSQRWFVVRDLGTALGSTARVTPLRGNLEAFETLGFIKYVENGSVVFDYHGLHQELFDRRITPADVVWAARLLARISPAQWADAFRAGGYTPDVSNRFITRLKEKIEDGLALEHLTERN